MSSDNNARLAAAGILSRWLRDGSFPDRELKGMQVPNRAFVMEMVYGIVRRRRLLEWVIGETAERRPDSKAMPFLLVGLYQVLCMDDVADYAVVSETVNAARAGGARNACGFLNAILRRVVREEAQWRARIASLPVGIRESHPECLVERWCARFGAERTEALCRWNNTPPRVVLHPDRRRTTKEAYHGMLREAGIRAEPHPFAPSEFLILERGLGVPSLPGFNEGLFTVRDPSTEVAVGLLDPRPGEAVLDACAAPGGKACGIVERMGDRGHLVAMDLHEDRLDVLRANLARMQAGDVQVVRGDASHKEALAKTLGRTFDRVLLDVPCTNTGVLRRRPDARWRISERKILKMARTQRRMLDAVEGLVKPGGTLVYSTCSLEPEEGADLVHTWQEAHPDFSLAKEISLFPPETRTDGVYAARLVRGTDGNNEARKTQ